MNQNVSKFSEKEIEDKIEEFQEWLRNEPNLPKTLDKLLLARYLKIFNYRLEKAQKLLKHGLEMREKNFWYFHHRDPNTPEMRRIVETIDMIPLFKHTKENYKVCVYQLLSDDANKINFNECVKAYFMCCDVRFALPVESFNELESGEIIIFDMKNLTFKHLTRIVLSTLRMFFKYLQDAHPVKIIQLHVINCTPVVNKAMMLIKPLMYSKLYNTLKFHNAGSYDSLYEVVPREILPSDFGGDGESMADMKKYWLGVLNEHRDFVMNDDYFKLHDTDTKNYNKERQKVGGIFSFLTS